MKWKLPPKIKIYEALGCLGDGRIEVSGNTAKVYSSSGEKLYEVKYDPDQKAIMLNDNDSYWQGYLGYPSIAFLLKKDILQFDGRWTKALADIAWKDANTQFKSDYEKTVRWIHEKISRDGLSVDELVKKIHNIEEQIKNFDLKLLGKKMKPPAGY